MGGQDSFFLFVGWVGGGDENHPVQGEKIGYFLCRAQVAQVDGVEGAAEEADFIHVRICPEP
jgi:hypothetical protein